MNERYLRFHDLEIERKYYEDEYLKIIQVLKYQIYLGSLISVVLIIMAFIQSKYALYLGGMCVTLLLPMIMIILAKRFPYQCNKLLSFNNIMWCILISATYMWRSDSFVDICSENRGGDSSSCSYLFILGGGFYTLHLALLIGTNFLLNVGTFVVINTIYVFSVSPSIPNLLCILILAPLCVGITTYAREKNARLYYELINKYYIWYHIANNVLPQKIIITKSTQKGRDAFQLHKLNRRARKEFNINTNEELQQFIQKIELKQESHQSIPIQEDYLNIHNPMDSLHSKSLGVISQVSKKSLTSRQSQRMVPRQIPLEVLLRREIRRQNSNDMQGQVDQPSTLNQVNINQNMNQFSHQNGTLNHNMNNMNNINNNNNLNTTTQDFGAMYMRNKKRSLFQMEDPGLQSMANPSQKQRKGKKVMKRTKLEKYKGTFKNDVEGKKKFNLTLICYSKDEQYQLIMIEDDPGISREQILDEQIQQYKNISMKFANVMMDDTNVLQFYIQQIKQNNQLKKNITNYITDASYHNSLINSKINNYLEFYNFENKFNEINPKQFKQFSLKKLIKDLTTPLEQRMKQNSIQLIISNDCTPEMDMIYNDYNRLKHIINYLLFDCIQNTQKGQIVISTSTGAAEMGDVGDLALTGTIKINIRDTSPRKYTPEKNNDYYFQSNNIQKIEKNKNISKQISFFSINFISFHFFNKYFHILKIDDSIITNSQKTFLQFLYKIDFSEIEMSVCKQILKMIGPQGSFFYMSESKNNINRVSFYIFTDILQGEGFDISNSKGGDLLPDDDDGHEDDDEEGNEFQAEIQNSDDDTYKNNNEQSPSQEINNDNQINPIQSSNQNPSSIYIYHGVDSRNNNQGSGLLFSSAYQLQQQANQTQSSAYEKYQAMQQHQQSLQNQQIQNIIAQNNQQQQSTLQLLQQSQTQFSQSITNNQLERIDKNSNISNYQIQTQPERPNKQEILKQHELRKSTSQLFEESDKIEDENQVSEVYIKELSQTSVKFKREISRKLSHRTNFFKNSIDDLEYNSKINSLSRINNIPLVSNQIRNTTLNNISKSLMNALLISITIVSILY